MSQKREKTTKAWLHFNLVPEENLHHCKHCAKTFSMSTSTSSLLKHLKQEHMDMPEVCSSLVPRWKSGEAVVVFDTAKADELVTCLIANKCLPMWLVDDEDLMPLMAYLLPTEKPPTRCQLWRQHLPQMQHELHRRMQSRRAGRCICTSSPF